MNKQYLKDYTDHAFNVSKIDLTFLLDPKETKVIAKMSINKVGDHTDDCELYGESLQLIELKLNGQTLQKNQYKVDESKLILKNVPNSFDLEVITQISPIENKTLSGLYMSRGNFCTQCESHGFRRIMYFIDRPDNMTEFTTHIIADKKKYPVLLGNGNCIDVTDMGDQHKATWYDPSLKPSYLFAIVAGEFESIHDTFTTMEGKEVKLGIYVEPGKIDQASFAMDALKLAMKWDEDTFGRAYDLTDYNIVGVSDFNFGAMENKGLNVFNTACMLANPKTSTDADYIQVLGVIGHEYFHNWTGNRITLKNWFQLSLKEGLTVFRDQTFTADLTEPVVKRIQDVHILRTHQFLEDAGPMSHPVRPHAYVSMNNFYTTTVYNKGAEVVRMLKTILGDEGFKAGMALYFDRHDGQAVTTDDFVAAHADANDVNLDQFKLWYDQSGTPKINIICDHNLETGQLKLICEQVLDEKKSPKPFLIPFKIGFLTDKTPINPNQTNVIEREDGYVLLIDKLSNEFIFEGLFDDVTLSLNRGFSAPVIVEYERSLTDLINVIRTDSDLFNRWDALQQYSIGQMKAWLENDSNLENEILNSDFIDALLGLIRDCAKDGKFLSVCFTPIQPRSLLDQLPGSDILKINRVCSYFYKQIATHCQSAFENAYKIDVVENGESFNYDAISQRALKNIALLFLSMTEKNNELAKKQFDEAKNMTETMGALCAFNLQPSDVRDQSLETFKQTFADDALVINKWFALHASIKDDSVHNKVRSLLKDPLYNKQNPNDVRALVGSYMANPLFHDRSYDNYEWLTDMILDMDEFNPQLAARFVQPFMHHRLYDEGRSAEMVICLEKLQSKAKSKDLKEVVTSALIN